MNLQLEELEAKFECTLQGKDKGTATINRLQLPRSYAEFLQVLMLLDTSCAKFYFGEEQCEMHKDILKHHMWCMYRFRAEDAALQSPPTA